jgi:hypothetical protein
VSEQQQKNYADMSEAEKKKEDWMNSKWRPMMGWMYMLVCIADFVLFPILWSLIQAMAGGQVHSQWQPITLQGAGLFHIAMGAVLGIAAFGRTQEKLGGANNGGITPPSPSFSTPSSSFSAPKAASSYSAPSNQQPLGNSTSQFSTSFGGNTNQFASTPTMATTPGMPAMSKPMSTGPIDDDYMPPRE